MDVWLYTSRKGRPMVFAEHARHKARAEQDADNRCTWEQARDMGLEVNGDPDFGYFSIDDGGTVEKVTVEE